ncbi:MAG: magnesium-translocating P-type ATPase [bacterium]
MISKQGELQKWPGLTQAEVIQNTKKYGTNEVVKKKSVGPFWIFVSKLKNPLFILMLSIATVTFFLGEKVSSIIVLLMVVLSTVLDFLNSYKSQKAVESLISRVSTKVTVIRTSLKIEVDFKSIVPGDVICLVPGSIIPADCEILEADDLYINQSSLTGESLPIEKIAKTEATKKSTSQDTIDQYTVFMGSSVISGFATVIANKTGAETEYGKIAKQLNKPDPKTDFEISITSFSYFIVRIIFYMVSFVMIVYLVKNLDNLTKNVLLEAITFAVAITIGVTPDMLPAIMTLCLARGSQMMAKKDVIVKHLSSIENFGSMDILCTDKTGTLTKDHISLVKHLDYKGSDSIKVLELGHLTSHFHNGMQNPLDDAINEFKNISVADYEKIDEIPYDFTRKRSSMVIVNKGKRLLITKGAPEEIFKICSNIDDKGLIKNITSVSSTLTKQFNKLSQDGFRVLAISYKELPNKKSQTDYKSDVETEMTFSGFLAFLDPPKDDVTNTILDLNKLGIEVKILTGDNHLLAQKICKDVGINVTGVITGDELKQMNDIELSRLILTTTIFARITPDQKERIILALKKLGKSVGYMGDGINDAPALKVADVGISVNNAVDIAKETASIILMQKSLNSLKDGVEEGRKTFHNTTKYVLMGLSSNFGNMFSMMGAVTFLPFLPMLPTQILLNNFLYDLSQMTLPTDTVDADDLLRPAHWDLKFIRTYMLVFGLMSSIFDFLTFWLLYFVYNLGEAQFQTGWLIESFATQVFVIYIIRTKKIPFIQSRPSKSLVFSTVAAVILVWSIQFTPLAVFLKLQALPAPILGIIVGYVLAYLFLVQVVKSLFYKIYFRNKSAVTIVEPQIIN